MEGSSREAIAGPRDNAAWEVAFGSEYQLEGE